MSTDTSGDPTLHGERVLLRPHRPEDAPRIVEQCTDPLMQRFTNVPRPYTVEDAEKFVASMIAEWESPKGVRAFVIEDINRPSVFCGGIDLRQRSSRVALVGFGLHPDARGDGLMVDALRTVCSWWFEQGGEAVLWEAWVGNTNSIAVASRAGFTIDRQPQRSGSFDHNGAPIDCFTGSLHRDDPMEPTITPVRPVRLEGDGLILREWTAEDVQNVELVDNAPPENAFGDISTSAAEQRERLESWRLRRAESGVLGKTVNWAVTDGASGRVVGDVSLYGPHFPDDVELGYFTFTAARNQGVATRAVQLVSTWALRSKEDGGLGARGLRARHRTENHVSARVLANAGLVPVGVAAVQKFIPERPASVPCPMVLRQRVAHPEDTVNIVYLTTTDWRRLRNLTIRALAEDPDSFGWTLADALTVRDGEWVKLAADGHFVAVVDGVDSGLVRFSTTDPTLQLWTIHSLWVCSTVRGRGVARALLAAGEDFARTRGANVVNLGVMTSATAAISLYRGAGYTEIVEEPPVASPEVPAKPATECPSPSCSTNADDPSTRTCDMTFTKKL